MMQFGLILQFNYKDTLFPCKQTIPDIRTVQVSFLYVRVPYNITTDDKNTLSYHPNSSLKIRSGYTCRQCCAISRKWSRLSLTTGCYTTHPMSLLYSCDN